MKDSAKQRVHRFVSNDLTVRIACVDATDVVREMQVLQNTLPIPTVAVGRAMVGAILMASQLKDGQQVGLLFKGNGALGTVYAEANYNGQVRGFTPETQFQPANYEKGLSLKEALGFGTLTVARHQPFQKSPYQGTVEMTSGEISPDIAHYLLQSQQIRSLVNLGVYLDEFGKVQAAGGILIEVMPGVEDAVVDKIQANAEVFVVNISELLVHGADASDLVKPYMMGVEYSEIDHEHMLEYYCPCTKERVMRALEVLGLEDLEDMISKNEQPDVTCQMCGRPYKVQTAEIVELKDRLYKGSLH